MSIFTKSRAALLGLGASAALLVACGSDDTGPTAAPSDQGAAITVTDAWVKTAEEGMTSGFGNLENISDREAVLVGATSDVAGHVEIHDTIDEDGRMSMTPVEDLPIPADETVELAPGGNHLMLMDINRPIKAGDSVEITLRFQDGTTQQITALARDYTGALEEYDPADHDHGDHADHDHGADDSAEAPADE